jgi:hypothetical protein
LLQIYKYYAKPPNKNEFIFKLIGKKERTGTTAVRNLIFLLLKIPQFVQSLYPEGYLQPTLLLVL